MSNPPHQKIPNARRGLLPNGAFLGADGKFAVKGTTQERFMAMVRKGPEGKCWRWTGNKDKYGYGRMKLDGRCVRAPRISFSLFRGAVPKGIHVLHACDMRWCVNPDHLRLGTNRDNTRDAARKGRMGRHNKHDKKRITYLRSRPSPTAGAPGSTSTTKENNT